MMQQYFCIHTFGPNAMTRNQVQQFSQAVSQAADIQGIQSYVNLSEGKAVCILEARDKGTLDRFFKKMGMPVDSITAVEMEGERGTFRDLSESESQGETAGDWQG